MSIIWCAPQGNQESRRKDLSIDFIFMLGCELPPRTAIDPHQGIRHNRADLEEPYQCRFDHLSGSGVPRRPTRIDFDSIFPRVYFDIFPT